MPPIPLWPAPRDPRLVAELLDAAERRDPAGHAVHLVLAGLFCVFGGLATSTLEISAGILLVFAALRLPHTWRTYPPTLCTAIALSFAAWIGWNATTIAWSRNVVTGYEQLASSRMLLAVYALWPVIRHRRALALCLVAGMCVQLVGIGLNAVGVIRHVGDELNRYVGFGSHSGHVTLWLSMAAVAAIALLRGASPRGRVALVAAAGALVVGAFVAGGRGSLLGLLAGVVVILLTTLASVRLSRRQWAAVALIIVAIGGATLWARGDYLRGAVDRIERQLDRSERKGDPRSSTAYRLYWWGLALEEWGEAPVAGTGLGSWNLWARMRPETLRLADRLDTTTDDLILAHPHSVYLQTLGETGAIGGVLLLTVACTLVAGSVGAARRDPVALAGLAALAVWAVSSAFEGNHVSPRSMAALAVAVAFASLPALLLPREAGG